MAVDLRKKTDIVSATRFYLNRQGANVAVITDIVERADSTVWVVSPLGGMGRSTMGYDDTVSAFHLIEGDSVAKVEKLV